MAIDRTALNAALKAKVQSAKQIDNRSYATLATYIEEGDLFEDNALNGVL